MLRNIIGLLLALLILAGCGGSVGTGAEGAQPGSTAQATQTTAETTDSGPAEAQTVTGETYPNTLTVMSHDSFNLSTEVIAEFEKANNVKLQFLKAGDTGSALNRALLTRGNPLADVFFGVDNTFLSRALSADAFEPYAPQGLDQIPADLRLDPQDRLIPIDYGFVNLNYDKSSDLFKDQAQPEQLPLEDLTRPEFKGKVVVENPATSSPGLAFMLATVDYFGQEKWLDWWRQMKENGVVVVDGWETAYYTNFSGSSGQGPQPIVVSYATSPAAEVAFSEGKLTEPPTGNILPPKGSFRQIEFAGILKGTRNRALAEKWMDYMLSQRVQDDIMPQMVVYPVLPTAKIPEVYQQFAPVPQAPATLDPETIAQNRDTWIREWTEAVLR
ncbi:MAG TPA: thiamine ABC transporter substrate-binding protein [Herpetosiphonaceae bacterium]